MRNKYFLSIVFLCASFAMIAQTTVWKHEGDPAEWYASPDTSYWTNGAPSATQKTVFNVPNMGECWVTSDTTVCGQLVLGDNNHMGAPLVIKDGGILTSGVEGSTSWAGVGYNRNAHMIVEAGGTFVSNHRFHVGMTPAAPDTATAVLEVFGHVDVRSNIFSVDNGGWTGQTAECWIREGGRLDAPNFRMGANSKMDVTGLVVIAGIRDSLINVYKADGRLTALEGAEPPTITVYTEFLDTVTVISCSISEVYEGEPKPIGINNKVAAKASLGLYPNPAADVVNFTGVERADVKVYSITGQLVLSRENVSEISVKSLGSGLYFVEAKSNGKVFVDKLLIK